MNPLIPTSVATFEREVIESPIPVVVDFSAKSCPPCRALLPLLDRLAAEFAGHVKFVTVDIDTETRLAARFEIFAIPTLLMFVGGDVVEILAGTLSEKHLRTSIENLL